MTDPTEHQEHSDKQGPCSTAVGSEQSPASRRGSVDAPGSRWDEAWTLATASLDVLSTCTVSQPTEAGVKAAHDHAL